MLKVEQIVDILQDRKLTEVSRRSGVPYPTVLRVSKSDNNRDFAYSTIVRLSDYLEKPAVLV